MKDLLLDYITGEPWFVVLGVALLVIVVAAVAHRLGRLALARIARGNVLWSAVLRRITRPSRFVLPLVLLQLVWHAASDQLPFIAGVRQTNALLLIACVTWLATRTAAGMADGAIQKYPAGVADNLQARRVQTQARVLSRTASTIFVIAGLSVMLMTFPGVRQIGASLLASAGVAGIVAGIAARPMLSNMIAGLQIAVSQPIRIDDVLIVQGEWGRVEEIGGTFVVLKIWDERRLIIPLQWFIENPFQNWTRSSAQITGTVFLWVDYHMPLDPLREEALRLCREAAEWDGRLCLLQVTEAGERAMQLRILVTSASSGENWDLRCKVREGLLHFMQRDYPQFLPQTRALLNETEAFQANGRDPTQAPRSPAGDGDGRPHGSLVPPDITPP